MEVSREEGLGTGMAPRGKKRTVVGDTALFAGRLHSQEQHPWGDVLGEEQELVAFHHPTPTRDPPPALDIPENLPPQGKPS